MTSSISPLHNKVGEGTPSPPRAARPRGGRSDHHRERRSHARSARRVVALVVFGGVNADGMPTGPWMPRCTSGRRRRRNAQLALLRRWGRSGLTASRRWLPGQRERWYGSRDRAAPAAFLGDAIAGRSAVQAGAVQFVKTRRVGVAATKARCSVVVDPRRPVPVARAASRIADTSGRRRAEGVTVVRDSTRLVQVRTGASAGR